VYLQNREFALVVLVWLAQNDPTGTPGPACGGRNPRGGGNFLWCTWCVLSGLAPLQQKAGPYSIVVGAPAAMLSARSAWKACLEC
jgi:hypothetical protein